MTDSSADTRKLRILATSDLHMHLLAEDGPGQAAPSLARLMTVISDRRSAAAAQGRACLLFDNGDLLQGTPLADLLSDGMLDHPHPAAQLLCAAGYDAMGLGNHDLDYGLSQLEQFARALPCPLLSANLNLTPAPDWLQASVILMAGGLRVGVFSVLPPDTIQQTATGPDQELRPAPMHDTARTVANHLRQSGCDLVIVLAHTGLPGEAASGPDNRLAEITALPGIDAVVGGHSHHIFPAENAATLPEADIHQGTLHGIPTVMPGFAAQYLGEIDLDLQQGPDGWQVTNAVARLHQAGPGASEDQCALDTLFPVYAAARDVLNQQVGHSDTPLHSYFVPLGHCRPQALLAAAQMRAIDRVRHGTDLAGLPLVSLVSAAKAGGRGGANYFTDLPCGPIRLRDLGDIEPYPNHIWASVLTGAEIRLLLERSAIAFNVVDGTPATPLRNAHIPIFEFTILFGLDYAIDLTQPALFLADGTWHGEGPGRIIDLRLGGELLRDDQKVLVAGNNYRLGGGGGLPGLGPETLRLKPDFPARRALVEMLQDGSCFDLSAPWRFADPARGRPATFVTGPGAAQHLQEIAHLTSGPGGLNKDGFLELSITL